MGDAPQRVTAPLLDVLQAFLAHRTTELHGWAIIKATRRAGPTVYKILDRLEDAGWITARWDETEGPDQNTPRRRYYRLTDDAAQRAAALLSEHRGTGPVDARALAAERGGRVLALARAAIKDGRPLQEDWRGWLSDVLVGLDLIVERDAHPDDVDRARLAIRAVAGMFASAEEVEAAYLGAQG